MVKMKRVSSIALAMLMASSATVFAEVPKTTVVIGNKAYDFKYANDVSNFKEIKEALAESDEIFVKLVNGKWMDNKTAKVIDKKIIPKLTYRTVDGKLKYYMAEDGKEIEFGIERTAFVSDDEINIKFNMLIDGRKDLKELVTIGDKKLGEKDEVKVLEDGQTLSIKLCEKLKNENISTKIQLNKKLCNKDGIPLKENYERKIFIVNNANVKLDKKLDGDLNILKDNVSLRNIEVDGDVYVSSNNVNIYKCKIKGNLNLDPGEKGTVTINSTEAKRAMVLSGGDNSIQFYSCKFDLLSLNSKNKTRVKASGKSEIKETKVMSKGILDSNMNGFGKVKIEAPNNELVKLKGSFDEVKVLSCGTVKAEIGAKIKNLILNNIDAVTLDGFYEKVTIDCKAEVVNLAPKTKVKILVMNSYTEIKGDSSVEIGKIETENKNMSIEKIKDNIAREIKTGVKINEPVIGGGGGWISKPTSKNKIVKEVEKDGVTVLVKDKNSNKKKITLECKIDKPKDISNSKMYTITICDSKDRIVNQIQDNIVDNKFSLTRPLERGSYRIYVRIPEHNEKIEFNINW